MSSDGTYNYSYDGDGNLTMQAAIGSGASWTYAYDAADELTEVKQYDSSGTLVQTADYSYDAFGEEIEKSDAVLTATTTVSVFDGLTITSVSDSDVTTVTKFAYDAWNPAMPAGTGNANFMQWAVLNSDDSLQSRNIDGNSPGMHLARVDQSGASDPAGVYYILGDRLNSVRDVVDSTGTVQDAIAYDAYGNILSGETDASYRGWYAWSGQEFDAQTDLQYNNARWYDAATGRWISQDPLGFDAGDSNLYRYVKNAPTDAADPSGLVYQVVGAPRIVTKGDLGELDKQAKAGMPYTDLGKAAAERITQLAPQYKKFGIEMKAFTKLGKLTKDNAEIEVGKGKTAPAGMLRAAHALFFVEWDVIPDEGAVPTIITKETMNGVDGEKKLKETTTDPPVKSVPNKSPVAKYFELAKPAGKATHRIVLADAPGFASVIKAVLGQTPYDREHTIDFEISLEGVANSTVKGTFVRSITKDGKFTFKMNGKEVD